MNDWSAHAERLRMLEIRLDFFLKCWFMRIWDSWFWANLTLPAIDTQSRSEALQPRHLRRVAFKPLFCFFNNQILMLLKIWDFEWWWLSKIERVWAHVTLLLKTWHHRTLAKRSVSRDSGKFLATLEKELVFALKLAHSFIGFRFLTLFVSKTFLVARVLMLWTFRLLHAYFSNSWVVELLCTVLPVWFSAHSAWTFLIILSFNKDHISVLIMNF